MEATPILLDPCGAVLIIWQFVLTFLSFLIYGHCTADTEYIVCIFDRRKSILSCNQNQNWFPILKLHTTKVVGLPHFPKWKVCKKCIEITMNVIVLG